MAARELTTILITGMPTRNDQSRFAQAFTLIELIVVMALLATFLALSAPSLSRSFKARGLEQEATQLLAITEYARDEAISQGVPMTVWITPDTGDYGVSIKENFPGDKSREKSISLNSDFRFDPVDATTDSNGHIIAAELEPDGTLAPESLAALRIVNRSEEGISVSQTADGLGYEIVKDPQ